MTMTKTEIKREVKALKVHREQVTASEANAKKFLINAGILEKNGKRLSPSYR